MPDELETHAQVWVIIKLEVQVVIQFWYECGRAGT